MKNKLYVLISTRKKKGIHIKPVKFTNMVDQCLKAGRIVICFYVKAQWSETWKGRVSVRRLGNTVKFVATNPLPTDINLYTFRFHGCCIYTLPLHFRFLWEITVNLSMVSFPLGLLFAKKYVLLLLTLGEMLMECFWFSLFTPLCDRISLSIFSYPLEDRFFISYYSERFTCYLRMSRCIKKEKLVGVREISFFIRWEEHIFRQRYVRWCMFLYDRK